MSKVKLKTSIVGASLATVLLLSGCASATPEVLEPQDSTHQDSSNQGEEELAVVSVAKDYFSNLFVDDVEPLSNALQETTDIIVAGGVFWEDDATAATLADGFAIQPEETQIEILEVLSSANPVSDFYDVEGMSNADLIALNTTTLSVMIQLSIMESKDSLVIDSESVLEEGEFTYVNLDLDALDSIDNEIIAETFDVNGIPFVETADGWKVSGKQMLAFFEVKLNEAIAKLAE